ncbi:MAG: hypothetical protein V4609_01940 [Pseudomonadota bacterium]
MSNVNNNSGISPGYVWGPQAGGAGDAPEATAAGNLKAAPSDAEVRRAVGDMVAALRAGGISGMAAPIAVSQTFANNQALQATILAIPQEQRTQEMADFMNVMGMATLVFENLVRNKDALADKYGFDVTALKAEDDNATLMKDLAYTSIDMYSDMSVLVTSFMADLAVQQLETNEKAVEEMKTAAQDRYTAAMISACFSVASGITSAAMGFRGASKQLEATRLDAGGGGQSLGQRGLASLTGDNTAASLHADATRLESASRSVSHVVSEGIGKAISEGFNLSASGHDATVKELDGQGQFLAQMQQTAQQTQGWLSQAKEAIAQSNLANINSSLEAQKRVANFG